MVLNIFAATVWEQTSTFRMVTMATGVASAGLSRCFNRACWWMTPLLYHSMLCHLQLHTTPALSPPHPRMLLYCLHWRKWISLKTTNKQTNKKTSPVEILPYDKRNAWLQWAPGMWGKCCWPQWRRDRHPVGDGLDMRLCPDTATRLKRGQAAVLSFDWITEAGQRWGKWKKRE